MLCFPALRQFPVRVKKVRRTVLNELPGGSVVSFADAAGARIEWTLAFEDLSDAEAGELESFHAEVEGALRTFTFLAPAGNLLAWSNKLDEAVWEKDPLLSAAEIDGGWRLTNQGPVAARLRQTLAAPAWGRYCVSAWLTGTGQATVLRGEARRIVALTPAWVRVEFGGVGEGTAETVGFGIEVDANATLDVKRLQVEAQVAASAYIETASRSGVYANARLGSDVFRVTATGVNRNACVVRIHAAD